MRNVAVLASCGVLLLLMAAMLTVIRVEGGADGIEVGLSKVIGGRIQLQENQFQEIESPQGDGPSGRFPYVVSIRAHGTRQHVCTGVLVTKKYVLTAAHCVDPTSSFSAGSKPNVYIGASDAHQENSKRKVATVINSFPHGDWDGEQKSPYNAALLELHDESDHPVPEIVVDHYNGTTGSAVFALGFGVGCRAISVGSPVFGSLKQEHADLVDHKQCSEESAWGSQVKKGLLCAMNDFQSSSCTVDSGSPLLILGDAQQGLPTQDILLGVNIDGAPCGTMNRPDIFLDLKLLKNWIKKTAGAGV